MSEEAGSALAELRILMEEGNCPMAVCAMQTLLSVIRRSDAKTMMALQEGLTAAHEEIWDEFSDVTARPLPLGRSLTPVSLRSGLELFQRYITRVNDDIEAKAFERNEAVDFEKCKARLARGGAKFIEEMQAAPEVISGLAAPFIPEDAMVLTHGYSPLVVALLERAKLNGRNFSVAVTEARPLGSGAKMVAALNEADILCILVSDTSVAFYMETVDIVLVGAEAVVESGGVVGTIGTASIAANAKALSKPFYVAAETFKFARLYPLRQNDLPSYCKFLIRAKPAGLSDDEKEARRSVKPVESPSCDYTSGDLITLLFTDIGVRTPAAISDELISFYQ